MTLKIALAVHNNVTHWLSYWLLALMFSIKWVTVKPWLAPLFVIHVFTTSYVTKQKAKLYSYNAIFLNPDFQQLFQLLIKCMLLCKTKFVFKHAGSALQMRPLAWKRILPILLIPAGCVILYLQNKGKTKFGKDSKFICGRWTEELVKTIKRRESKDLGQHGTLLGRQVIS